MKTIDSIFKYIYEYVCYILTYSIFSVGVVNAIESIPQSKLHRFLFFFKKIILDAPGCVCIPATLCHTAWSWRMVTCIWYTYKQMLPLMTSSVVKCITITLLSAGGGWTGGDLLLHKTIKGVEVVGEWGKGELLSLCSMSHCWQPDSPAWLSCWSGFWLVGVLAISSPEHLLHDIHEVCELPTNPWFSSGEIHICHFGNISVTVLSNIMNCECFVLLDWQSKVAVCFITQVLTVFRGSSVGFAMDIHDGTFYM